MVLAIFQLVPKMSMHLHSDKQVILLMVIHPLDGIGIVVHIRGQNVTQGLLQVFALAVCHLFRHGMVPAGLTGQVMSLRVQLTETVMN